MLTPGTMEAGRHSYNTFGEPVEITAIGGSKQGNGSVILFFYSETHGKNGRTYDYYQEIHFSKEQAERLLK